MKLKRKWGITIVALLASTAFAADNDSQSITVEMGMVSQVQPEPTIGSVMLEQTKYGVLITPNLKGLTPGVHGFHLHQAPTCENFGQAALGHFDPLNTGKHLGPYNDKGHLGDLPTLIVNQQGVADHPILAPRLDLKTMEGHSLMIHAGGDTYSDTPAMGGGGERVACGVVPIVDTAAPADNAHATKRDAAQSAATTTPRLAPSFDNAEAPIQPLTMQTPPLLMMQNVTVSRAEQLHSDILQAIEQHQQRAAGEPSPLPPVQEVENDTLEVKTQLTAVTSKQLPKLQTTLSRQESFQRLSEGQVNIASNQKTSTLPLPPEREVRR